MPETFWGMEVSTGWTWAQKNKVKYRKWWVYLDYDNGDQYICKRLDIDEAKELVDLLNEAIKEAE